MDRDRQRVYDAEDAAFLETSYADRLGKWGCQWLLEQIVATEWWTAIGGARPTLRAGRIDSTRSTVVIAWGMSEVRIGPGMDQPHVLSHEMAHLVAPGGAAHGELFRRAHLDVAAVILGSHGATRLAERYSRASLRVGARAWPAPPDPSDGGLLAVWRARLVLVSRRP